MTSFDSLSKIFVGPVVHSTNDPQLNITDGAALVVCDGKVATLGKSNDLMTLKAQYKVADFDVIQLGRGQFLMPGLVDTHIHAPQYPNAGLGYDKTLLGWLESYTFPMESKYKEQTFASQIYETVVRRTLHSGTTTACYFATVHEESSLLLARVASRLGQRALIGKVNMNVNHPPDYGESTSESLASTERFIQAVRDIGNSLVQPIITPRFAITCDTDLMKKLGELADQYNVHVQTHISENKTEVNVVREMYPDSKNYTAVYDNARLLTAKTVLAHAIYLEDEELHVIAERGTSIAHCPNSNLNLRSGLCDIRRLRDANIKVGLGTDCSGGSSISVIDAMRLALHVSNCISFSKSEDYRTLNYHEALHLATLGGAQALSLDGDVGNFTPGKQFDALLIDMSLGTSDLLMENYTTEELVQKFVYLADDRNIKQVYVAGVQRKEG